VARQRPRAHGAILAPSVSVLLAARADIPGALAAELDAWNGHLQALEAGTTAPAIQQARPGRQAIEAG
jgi:hypothetical protein